MRIIGGSKKGLIIKAPNRLPVRPTTDRAKEALFNILENQFDLSQVKALDLFSGTGNIAFELASRGAQQVLAIDQHALCCKFIKEQSQQLGLKQIQIRKGGIPSILNQLTGHFDLIFADPPYNWGAIQSFPDTILNADLLSEEGFFVQEHPKNISFEKHPHCFDIRNYGQSVFSFFNGSST